MKNNMKGILLLIISLCVGICLWLVFTPNGNRMLIRQALSVYLRGGTISFDVEGGSILKGITLKNIEVADPQGLPKETSIKIQSLFLKNTSLNILNGLVLNIENARVFLPDSNPIVITGSYDQQKLDFNIYSNGFSLREFLGYFSSRAIPLNAQFGPIDFFIQGALKNPELKGDFLVEKIIYGDIVLLGSQGEVNLSLKDVTKNIQASGHILLKDGKIQTPKVTVLLDQSRASFSGPLDQPWVNVRGKAVVEGVKISIILQGKVSDPKLQLSSTPPLSKDKLMIMLATGKSWKALGDSLEQGKLTPDVAKDFIDYFISGSEGNKFAERFGLKSVSVKHDKSTKGVAATKDLSDRFEAGYEIEQQEKEQAEPTLIQKIKGEYKITDEVSVGAQKELKEDKKADSIDAVTEEPPSDDKIYLKYQKTF